MSESKNLSAASIRQRLYNQARNNNRPYNEILQFYVIERFLYRISLSDYADKFILKGALMFLVWGVPGFRSTRDIDLLGFTSNDVQNVERVFQHICSFEVEADGLIFDPQSVRGERIREDADYEGVRIHLIGHLDRARVSLQIDIGFADVVSPAPVPINYPSMLQMNSALWRGYPKESVVAEKVQAMIYLGEINSRMKDFYDLWLLAVGDEFDGRLLQEAIENTFQQRKTKMPGDIPRGLDDPFAIEKQKQWQAFLARTGIETAPKMFLDVVQILRSFLIPVIQSSVKSEQFIGKWLPSGPWR
jgi:hypothetical protein